MAKKKANKVVATEVFIVVNADFGACCGNAFTSEQAAIDEANYHLTDGYENVYYVAKLLKKVAEPEQKLGVVTDIDPTEF